MKQDISPTRGVPVLVAVASFVIVVAGMKAAQSLLVPFLLAAFLAVISAPSLFWLQRNRVPMPLALLIVLACVIAILVALAALVGNTLDGFSRALPEYQARLAQQSTALMRLLSKWGVDAPVQQLLEQFNPNSVMNFVAGMLRSLGGVLTNAFLILLTVVFILLEASSLPTKMRAIFGGSQQSQGRLDNVTANIQRYMAIKTWFSLATGVAIAIWLWFLGVDFPLLWGLLAFLLNYVPNIGSIIAAVPAVLLALVQLGFGSALWVAFGYLVVNVVVGTVLEPRFMGRGLGLSTLVVFVSLVFWGWVLGPVGMFLSVPLTMSVRIALDSSERTRWLAILLASEASVRAALAVDGPAPELPEARAPKPEPKPDR
ncbi:MAG: AI-2E family transporter [Acidiferrobacterales bacterium]